MIILLVSEDLEGREPRGRAHISMDKGWAGDGDGDEGVDILARRKGGSIGY